MNNKTNISSEDQDLISRQFGNTAEELSKHEDGVESGMNSQSTSSKDGSDLNRVFGNTPEDIEKYGKY